MQLIPILASAATAAPESEKATIADALPHLTGMVMVFATLAILWGLCVLSANLVKRFAPAPAAPAPRAKPAPAPAAPTTGPTPELVAVISAAVATVTGGKSRIVSIRTEGSSWGTAGRQSVLSSHRIRK